MARKKVEGNEQQRSLRYMVPVAAAAGPLTRFTTMRSSCGAGVA